MSPCLLDFLSDMDGDGIYFHRNPQEEKGTILYTFRLLLTSQNLSLPATVLYSSTPTLKYQRASNVSLVDLFRLAMEMIVDLLSLAYGNDLGLLSWKNPTAASHQIPTCFQPTCLETIAYVAIDCMTSFFPPAAMASAWESFRPPQPSLPNREMIDLCFKFPHEGPFP